MKPRSIAICIALVMNCLFSSAQKKWDGEGKDNQWKNPANWSPDGVPGIGDDVILDHTWLQEAFMVFLQDTITHAVNSLTIMANPLSAIQLIIPSGNTQSPALHLNTNTSALLLGENALLINKSGATAGNAITLNGNLIIQNGGRYLHGTLRGNTVLVSKLTGTDLHRKGIFEFDVPGTSGYILSVSGRQFGTLQLSSSTAGKKTYSGSGNGNATIKGDLIITDSSTLNLSINGNVLISGNLKVLGKFQWQPGSADSTGRELLFNGDSSQLISTGTFKMGTNFRKMVVAVGKTNLKSNLRFDYPSQGVHVLSRTAFKLDSNFIAGPGWFQTDSLATLILGSSSAIDDTSSGAIRTAILNLHPGTMFSFTGDLEQSTGTRFPEMARTLILQKTKGGLTLTKNLVISDSISLEKGIISSHYNAMLEFKGKNIVGSSASFIKGPLKRTGNLNGDLIFPIGDSSYAPTIISVSSDADDLRSYTISYHSGDPSVTDSFRAFPVKSIGRNEYWNINRIIHQGSSLPTEILRLPISTNSLNGINGQPNIIHLDSTEMKWIMFPFTIDHQYPSNLSSAVQVWKNGYYTFGELEAIGLPNERLFLQWKRQVQNIRLDWQISGDPEIKDFILEFTAGPGNENKWQTEHIPNTKSHFIIYEKNNEDQFIRLKGITANDDTLISNTIRITGLVTAHSLFPNPACNRLYIRGNENGDAIVLLSDGRSINLRIMRAAGQSYVDINSIPNGLHRIGLRENSKVLWHSFYKR